MLGTMHYTGTLVLEECCNCGISFAMPSDFRSQCLRDHSKSFYCPSGHGQVFSGETEAQKLRRQLNYTRDSETWYKDQLGAAERSKAAIKGHLTRARNKIAVGNCPVPDCGQHFSNVREHMNHKHPDWHMTDPETGKKAVL